MTFDEAMRAIKGRGSRTTRVSRPGLPGLGVTMRPTVPGTTVPVPFPHPVLMRTERTWIAYTPTAEDMAATDWQIREAE